MFFIPCYLYLKTADKLSLFENIFLKNIDVEIPTTVRDNVIITAVRVVELAERGINIPFYNIVEMKNILLNE